MGVLKYLVPGLGDNPFYNAFDKNRGKISGAFGGMVGAGNDPRQALMGFTQGLHHGVDVDTENELIALEQQQKKDAIAKETQQQNYTIAALQKAGRQDLIDRVTGGGMTLADAWTELYKPKPGPIKASEGDVFLDPNTMQPISSIPKAQAPFTLGPNDTQFGPDNKPLAVGQPATKTENVPAGYRANPDGTYSFIPGGPADPATAGKTTEATRRNQELAKVMVPEAVSLLGDGTTMGTFDALSNGLNQAAGSNPLTWGMSSPEYQRAKNSIDTIVASYLYSVSGATATPGEVQRLADSVTPKPFESPASVADKKARLQTFVQTVVEAAKGTPSNVTGLDEQSSGDPELDDLLKQYGD